MNETKLDRREVDPLGSLRQLITIYKREFDETEWVNVFKATVSIVCQCAQTDPRRKSR